MYLFHEIRRCFLAILLMGILTILVGASSSEAVRVGLYYSTNALPTANLQNEVGSGYEFGAYDSDGNFTTYGETDLEKITICKDTNIYLSGGTFYEAVPSGSYQLIGAYNLQLDTTYSSFKKAQAAAEDYPYGYPAYVDGTYRVRFEYFSTKSNAQAEAALYSNVSVVGESSTCYTVVDSDTGLIQFEYDQNGYFGVMPTGATTPETWFKGICYYGGFQYSRQNGNDLTVINFVPTDLYVVGVLPYEFVSTWPLESLKAGAVAIRTFASSSTKHSAYGFDVCTSTCCQVYNGTYDGVSSAQIYQAAEETHGLCAYYNGSLIETVYYSSNGGLTEDAANTWGSDIAYLKGKVDPYEGNVSFGGNSWEYTITPAAITSLLQARGNDNATIVSIAVTERTDVGNVNELTFTDSKGDEYTYTGDNTRLLAGLSNVFYMSRNFDIVSASDFTDGFAVYDGTTTATVSAVTVLTADGTTTSQLPATVLTEDGTETWSTTTSGITDGWVIQGKGYGHNVGMSQWGSYAMALEGFTYDEILKFYYTGITVE